MPDESTGSPGEGPPPYPAPPLPPPALPVYPATPSYEAPPSYGAPPGGYPPPSGHYAAPPYEGSPNGAPYAPWGTRLGGWLIDLVIFVVVSFVMNAIFRTNNTLAVRFTTHMNDGTVRHNHFSVLAALVTIVISLIYTTVLCGGPRGQTVGMMAVGVRVVRDGTHDAVGYGRALWRSVVELVFRYTIVIWILDWLFPLWDSKNQTLHDKLAKTVVFRIRHAG